MPEKSMRRIRIIALAIVVSLLLSGCGLPGGEVESILDVGQDEFIGGRESVLEVEENVGDTLEMMIELYGGGYKPPQIIELDEDPLPSPSPSQEGQDESSADQSESSDFPDDGFTVRNRDELAAGMAEMIENAESDTVPFRAADGYVIDNDELTAAIETMGTVAWMNCGYVDRYYFYFGWNSVDIQIEYYIAPEEILQQKAAAVAKAAEIEAELGLANMSDLEKIVAVNDYLCETVTYPKNIDDRYDHSPYNTLCNGIGVCDGFARSAQLILGDVGVEAMVVVGWTSGGPHAWSLVKLDGNWYQMDCCWNATGGIKDLYLLVDDTYMSWSRIWDTEYYPAAVSGCYNFQ